MKFIFKIYLFTLSFQFISCSDQVVNNEGNDNARTNLSKELLYGEWRFRSSNDEYEKRHSVFICEDSTYYKFSDWNGGGLSDFGQLFGKDSIDGKYFWKYKYELIDSFKLIIIDYKNDTNFYAKSYWDDYTENLESNLRSDSLRNRILGWWKMEKRDRTIDLINHPENCNAFSLNIRSDGKAIFFLDNYLDSTVDYHYKLGPSYIDFSKGCIVGSNSYVTVNENKMSLVMDRFGLDTLVLQKVIKI